MAASTAGNNMHWIDACNKSRVNTAVREVKLEKQTIKMYRYNNGDGCIEKNGDIRKALQHEIEGYLDWMPYE